MQNKFTIKTKSLSLKMNFMIFLVVLYCFYSYGLQSFFTWKTFANGIFSSIAGIPVRSILSLFIVLYGMFFIVNRKHKKILFLFAIWILFIGFLILVAGGQKHIFSFEFLLYLVPVIFVLLPEDIQRSSYRVYYNVFVYSLIIPIIIYIFVHVGINIPYITLEAPEQLKTYNGIYYKLYPLAVQWNHNYNPLYYGMRMCGIYNEPGVVGTFSALLLCIEEYKFKGKWKNIILLIAGMFSFSIAFYLLTALFFTIQIISMNPKHIIVLLSIVLTYVVFINIPINNPSIARVQKRLTIAENGLVGNNRTNMMYDKVFNEFVEGNFIRVIFGNGASEIEDILEERNIDASTYKNLIYNYGILGFIGQILWILCYALYLSKNSKKSEKLYVFTFVLILFANMYQRPFMFSLQYYTILIGGLKNKLDEGIKSSETSNILIMNIQEGCNNASN